MKKLFLLLAVILGLPALLAFGPKLLAQAWPHEEWPFFAAQTTTAAARVPDLLWFQFTEGSGNDATNSAAAGLSNGVLASATWATGKSGSGYSIDFDGAATTMHVTNVAFGTSQITLTAWMFFDATNVAGNACLFELSTNVNYIQRNFRLLCTSAGNLAAIIHGTGDSANFRQESKQAPQTNAWVHLGVYFDNFTTAGDIKIYYDGVEQTTVTNTDTKNLTGGYLSTNFFIGARSSDNASRLYFNGKMDDIRIYSGELNSAGITAVMNDPK